MIFFPNGKPVFVLGQNSQVIPQIFEDTPSKNGDDWKAIFPVQNGSIWCGSGGWWLNMQMIPASPLFDFYSDNHWTLL